MNYKINSKTTKAELIEIIESMKSEIVKLKKSEYDNENQMDYYQKNINQEMVKLKFVKNTMRNDGNILDIFNKIIELFSTKYDILADHLQEFQDSIEKLNLVNKPPF